MSYDRDVIERRLLEDGLAALADPVVKRAVAEDPELRELVLALQELDGQLAALPPIDPPDGLVQSTLLRVAQEPTVMKTQAESASKPAATVSQATSQTAADEAAHDTPTTPPGVLDWIGRLFERMGRHPMALAAVAALILGVFVVNKTMLQSGDDSMAAQSEAVVVGGEDGWGDEDGRRDEEWSGEGNRRLAAGPSAPPRSAPAAAAPVGSSSTTQDPLALAIPEMQYEPEETSRSHRRRRTTGDRRQDAERRNDRGEDDAMNWPQPGELGGLVVVDEPSDPSEPDWALGDNLDDLSQLGRDFAAPVRSPRPDLGTEQGQGAAGAAPRTVFGEPETSADQLRARRGAREMDRNANLAPVEESEEEAVYYYRIEPRAAESPPPVNVELRNAPDAATAEIVTIDGERFDVSGRYLQAGQSGFHSVDLGDSSSGTPIEATLRERSIAEAFLVEREQVDLPFQEAAGYWSNTYVPGDPLARQLRRRLEGRRNTAINNGLAMALVTRPVPQPFDRPESGALTLQLQSDRRGVEGETRVLLQVGLQATERQGGLRPAMNVAVVVDMRQVLDDRAAASLRALLESLSEARQIGDRFGLYVAGRPGGELIAPGELRYGTVQLATRYLLDGEPLPEDVASGEQLGIEEAMARAIEATRAVDDPTAPLGTSLLMLVTPGAPDGSFEPVVELAHVSAIGGVPVSVVALNTHSLSTLDRIALAGHGNRRVLLAANEAMDLVNRELNAASEVVARALRLNIRLAPGVELIDVLGSEHLDERRAEQAREAERSIDVRVARSLGIQADRGEDDDGIQIIIPAFYSGDSHVVLLDVVVPGPGPVADVTVRYKDLVHLRNGEASNRLTLSRSDRARGQLELNVLRNLLAWRVSEALRDAGGQLAGGAVAEAEAELRAVTGLLAGIGFEVPVLGGDPGVAADLHLLSVYLGQLESYAYSDVQELAESMIYASYLKRLRPLDERAGNR